MPSQFAFRAHFASDARHFTRERVELIEHRVDRILQLENLAFNVDRDLARQIPAGHGGGYLGDIAYLTGKVAGH